MKTYNQNTLAFYDTFSGCIPCKVLSIKGSPGNSSNCKITVKLTAKRGAYQKGEIIESDALKIIPRNHVKGRTIYGGYSWEQTPQKFKSTCKRQEALVTPNGIKFCLA